MLFLIFFPGTVHNRHNSPNQPPRFYPLFRKVPFQLAKDRLSVSNMPCFAG